MPKVAQKSCPGWGKIAQGREKFSRTLSAVPNDFPPPGQFKFYAPVTQGGNLLKKVFEKRSKKKHVLDQEKSEIQKKTSQFALSKNLKKISLKK